MVYKQKLSKIGNSVGLTIPKVLRDSLGFNQNTEVFVVRDSNDKIIISKKSPTSEKDNSEFYKLLKNVSKKYNKALDELSKI